MLNILAVLHPATPPEPKNARLVRGKMGNLQVDEPDEPKPRQSVLSPLTTRQPSEYVRAYNRQKMREFRARKREAMLKAKREKSRQQRAEKRAAAFEALKGP